MTLRELHRKIAWLYRAVDRKTTLNQAITNTESEIASYLVVNGLKEKRVGSYEVRLDGEGSLKIDHKPPKPFIQLVMKEVLGDE
jgi:hypothetical protein